MVKKIHKEPRMYVIIRGDLHPTYAMVQGSHALAQFALKRPDTFKKWNNSYLIFLKVFNYYELLKEMSRLSYYRTNGSHKKFLENIKTMAIFKEPDLDNQLTAIAIYDDGRKVKGLPLA
jgi:hypothetical protein